MEKPLTLLASFHRGRLKVLCRLRVGVGENRHQRIYPARVPADCHQPREMQPLVPSSMSIIRVANYGREFLPITMNLVKSPWEITEPKGGPTDTNQQCCQAAF